MDFIATFFQFLLYALEIAIFGRVIMSWVSPRGNDPISSILIQMTEPLMAPIRRVLPQFGMFDLSPMVALLLLHFIGPHVVNLL